MSTKFREPGFSAVSLTLYYSSGVHFMYVPKFNEENDIPTLHSLIELSALG